MGCERGKYQFGRYDRYNALYIGIEDQQSILLVTVNLLYKVVSEEMVQRLKDNLKNLDRCLGCYPYDVWKAWQELTNHISPPLIERCSPECGYVKEYHKLLISVIYIYSLIL